MPKSQKNSRTDNKKKKKNALHDGYSLVKMIAHRFEWWILFGFLISVAAVYSFMSAHLHNRFMTFGLDLGYFDEAIWKISQGKFPYSGIGCIWLLEDHMQLILYLFAPLYWVWDDVRVILIAQAAAMVFAGLPLYLLSRTVTKSRLFSFSVVFSYLFFIGTQFAILNEFHQVTVAPLFIALGYLALERKNIGAYAFSITGLLIIKEDLALLVVAMGIGLLFRSGYRRLGVLTCLAGFISFFLVVYVLMPAISYKGVYAHFTHVDSGGTGFTPGILLERIQNDPLHVFRSLVFPAVKVETIIRSLGTFGFLPLLSPLFIAVPVLEDFVTRFLYSGPQVTKWALVNHHAATSAILLAIATAYAARNMMYRLPLKGRAYAIRPYNLYLVLAVFLVCATGTADVLGHGPIHSLLKGQFYEEEQWMRDARDLIRQVPSGGSVAAQNSLLPHLSHRDSIYRVPYGLNSEYMAFDLHDGPNKFSPFSRSEMQSFVDELITASRYSVVYQQGEAMLLKRNYKTDITKSPYFGDTRFCYYSFEER